MNHLCHATRCTTPVRKEFWGCPKHWRMVPKNIQVRIWATYRPGQCDDLQPSKQYLETAKEAVIAVALQEHILPDTSLYDLMLRRFDHAVNLC